MKLTFTDKTSYLTWRQEWKDNYLNLSKSIREQKCGRKQYLRTYQTTETPQGKSRQLIAKVSNPAFGSFSQWQLTGLQIEATLQLETLIEAKALSYVMKQANAAA